jgi:hypothetical protein
MAVLNVAVGPATTSVARLPVLIELDQISVNQTKPKGAGLNSVYDIWRVSQRHHFAGAVNENVRVSGHLVSPVWCVSVYAT